MVVQPRLPDIVKASANPADWLQPIPNEEPAFKMHAAGPADGIVVRPLYEVNHQRYSVYWQLHKPSTGINR